ncbi:MAG: prepilin-type N-terminal cleavage/methylation domain-containing protein [Synergistaceae bacterium]|nr:prepilin-type N-terminal cleavage/methylation domain-containing protein [Synergistaceae bacterium]
MNSRRIVKLKNGGFTLPEVICALMILVTGVLAVISSIGYTLRVTLDVRSRMNAFATVEREGISTIASQKIVSDPSVAAKQTTLDGKLSVSGTEQAIRLQLHVYRENSDVRRGQLMERPVFVFFTGETP